MKRMNIFEFYLKISSKDIFDLITKICSNTTGSSISYDFITKSAEYKAIVGLGDEALQKMLLRFEVTESNGLEEYVMAMACS